MAKMSSTASARAINTNGDQRQSNADHVANHARASSTVASARGRGTEYGGYHAASGHVRNNSQGGSCHHSKSHRYRGRCGADYEADYARASSTAASIPPSGGDYSPAAPTHGCDQRAPRKYRHRDNYERADGWDYTNKRDGVDVRNHYSCESYERPSRKQCDSDRHHKTHCSLGDRRDREDSHSRGRSRGWERKRDRDGPYDDSHYRSRHRAVSVGSRGWDHDRDGFRDPPRRARASDWSDTDRGGERNRNREYVRQRHNMRKEPRCFDNCSHKVPGDESIGYFESRNDPPSPKRFRYTDNHSQYSRKEWHRQSPRGNHCSGLSWTPRPEQPSNREVQELRLRVARLEKDIEDQKGAKKTALTQCASLKEGGGHQTEFLVAPSGDDTSHADGNTELTLGPRADSAQHSRWDPTSCSGSMSNGSPGGDAPPKFDVAGEDRDVTNSINQIQQAHPVVTCDTDGVNRPGQMLEAGAQENDSCYDASTDEEIDAPLGEAAASTHDTARGKASSDDWPLSGENANDKDPANNNPGEGEDASNAKYERNGAENENNQPVKKISDHEEIDASSSEVLTSGAQERKKGEETANDQPLSAGTIHGGDHADDNLPEGSEEIEAASSEVLTSGTQERKKGEKMADDQPLSEGTIYGGDHADDNLPEGSDAENKTDSEENTCIGHNTQEEANAPPIEAVVSGTQDCDRGDSNDQCGSSDQHTSTKRKDNGNETDEGSPPTEAAVSGTPDRKRRCKTSNDRHGSSDQHGTGGNKYEDPENRKDNGNESDEDSVDPVLKEDYDPLGKIAFCCQNCRCWETSRAKYLSCSHIRNNCGNSSGDGGFGNTRLFHRGCCHGDRRNNEDYLSAMQKAIADSINGNEKKKPASGPDTHSKLKKAYNTAKREESRLENEGFEEAKDCSIYSNPIYGNCTALFAKRRKARRSPLRVLDLFSGIGSSAVVLKRLQIPIDSIVHVEHDPVAVEVIKSNHKDDGITHYYVDTFEEIYGTYDEPEDEKIREFLDKYGFIELLLSGAPCQSYSGLNAARDETSVNAQYLKKVGRLIEKLDDIQRNEQNVKDHVLFLSENVVFKNHEHVDRCYLRGLPPIRMDAKDFSPCKRNRFYWTNLPVQNPDQVMRIASVVSVDGLLDKGYRAVARLLQDEDEQSSTPVKANAFLASMSRIDDNRMIKCKLDGTSSENATTKISIETYSIGEREKMMGLPPGYVEEPIKRLFNELAEKAFLRPESSGEGKSYRDFLPREFWHYRKKCHFKFHAASEPPFFQLALSSPQEGRSQPSFYMEEQYAKHLIGNGWSIPVAEHLLKSLTGLFADDVVRPTYDKKYAQPFPWKPYLTDPGQT